jgi:hypothetical protein
MKSNEILKNKQNYAKSQNVPNRSTVYQKVVYFYDFSLELLENEDNIYNKTLNKDNVGLPIEKELELQFRRIEWEKVAYDYEDTMSSYFTPEQIQREFWFFNSEDYIDIGSFNNTNKDWIDGEIEDESLTSVKEITPRQKESVNDYITNLSEGELDYMVKKLLDTHLHYNSK